MSIIALFNLAKEYFEQRKTEQTFRHLDNHFLKDIGFHRENGHIRPLSGNHDENDKPQEIMQAPPGQQPSDG